MSKTYQLSTAASDASAEKDPENRLYSHSNRQRLESEGIWDALLTASGKLDLSKIGGPSEELGDKMNRRGLYEYISRVFPNTIQTTFETIRMRPFRPNAGTLPTFRCNACSS